MIYSPMIRSPNAGQAMNSVHIQTIAQGMVKMKIHHHHTLSCFVRESKWRKKNRKENLTL